MARKIKSKKERLDVDDIANDRQKNSQLIETRVVTRLESPVSISSLFPAYNSEADVSPVFNGTLPRFSHHSNFIMSILSLARSETDRDSPKNYKNIPSPSTMSIFSPLRLETSSSLYNGVTLSIPW